MPATSVRGTVLDDFGQPLAGVIVSRKNAPSSTVTSRAGAFQIDAPLQSELIFTHPFFHVKEVRLKNAADVRVKLSGRYLQPLYSQNAIAASDDTTILLQNRKQLVPVLYGYKRPAEILGAVSTINGNQISTTPAPSYL